MAKRLEVADTFLDSYANLTASERVQVRRVLSLLLEGTVTSGLRSHKVGEHVSFSPNMDLRIIAVSSGERLVVRYVDHHDSAYAWAERHAPKELLVMPPSSGYAGSVDSRAAGAADVQIGYGKRLAERVANALPVSLLSMLHNISNVDELLEAIPSFSPQVQEVLLQTAVDIEPAAQRTTTSVIGSDAELELALRYPMDKWRLFLHPRQQLAAHSLAGSALLVLGGPGTGKTILLLHRAMFVANKVSPQIVLLLSYGEELCSNLRELCAKLGSVPANLHIRESQDALKDIRFNDSGGIYLCAGERHDVAQIAEIIVDEAQDLSNMQLGRIAYLAKMGIRHTLAFDMNQSVVRSKVVDMDTILKKPITVQLDYSYRLTFQIGRTAQRWFAYHRSQGTGVGGRGSRQLKLSSEQTVRFVPALTGPEVDFILVPERGIVDALKQVFDVLLAQYAPDEIAAISFFSPMHKTPSYRNIVPDLNSLVTRKRMLLRGPLQAKGLEWKAGVLIGADELPYVDLNDGHVSPGAQLAINGFYVAMTRFRDRVACLYANKNSFVGRFVAAGPP